MAVQVADVTHQLGCYRVKFGLAYCAMLIGNCAG